MPLFTASALIAARAACRSRGALAAGVLMACAALDSSTLGAQSSARPSQSDLRPASAWSLDAEYLHVGAGPIERHAGRSLGATLRRDFGGEHALGWSVDGGWMRAARVRSTAQGATLGAALRVPVRLGAASLVLRPGVSAMGGWAEAQQGDWLYDWRGLDGTPDAGHTGSEINPVVGRGRATGVGALLGAELRLSPAFAVTGSVRQWRFAGDVIRPDRDATLGGLGLTIRPGIARDARHAVRAGIDALWALSAYSRPTDVSSTTQPTGTTGTTTSMNSATSGTNAEGGR